jgi:hypothetical protein
LFSGASPATAEVPAVLSAVPGDAALVVIVPNLETALARASKVGAMVGAPPTDLFDALKQFVGVDQGLQRGGSLAFAVVSAKADEFTPVLFVPTNDFKALIAPLDPKTLDGAVFTTVHVGPGEFLVAKRGAFAVFASPAGEAALTKVTEARESFAAGALAKSADAAGEFAGDRQAVLLMGRESVRRFSEMGAKELERLAAAKDGAMGPNGNVMSAVIGIYRVLLETAGKELADVTVGVDIDDAGAVSVTGRLPAAAGGVLADFYGSQSGAGAAKMEGLPRAGPYVFAGAFRSAELPASVRKAAESFLELSVAILGIPPEKARELNVTPPAELIPKSAAVRMGVAAPGKPMMGGMAAIYRGVDAAKFLEYTETSGRKAAEVLNAAKGAPGQMTPLVRQQIRRVDVEGVAAVEVEQTFEFPNDLPPPVLQQMELMYGPDRKMTMRFAAADPATVVMVMGQDAAALKAAVEAAKSKAAAPVDALTAVADAMLPKGSQVVAYVSFEGYAALIQRMMAGMAPPNVPAFPDFPAAPPMGFALKFAPAEAEFRLAMPADTLKAIGTFVGRVKARFGGVGG